MIYLAKVSKPNVVGFVVGRDYAAVLRETSFVVRELGAWDAELKVERVHEASVPLASAVYPMRMKFEIRDGDVSTVGIMIALPEDGGGDLFTFDSCAWVDFARGWSPDGDFELLEFEVAKTAAAN